jgi:ribosomal protein L22
MLSRGLLLPQTLRALRRLHLAPPAAAATAAGPFSRAARGLTVERPADAVPTADAGAVRRSAQTQTQKRGWPLGVDGQPVRTASARRLGISTSPQKLNLVARVVRGLSVSEAHRQLAGVVKKHAKEVGEVIRAAVVNARSFGMDEERLVVSRAFVGKGKYLKRIRPWHGKGRHGVHHKHYAHLNIEVKELSDEMWEATVLPQYVHMRFRPANAGPAGRKLPANIVKPWLVRSQLDVSYEATKARAAELKSTLPPRRHPFPEGWVPDALAPPP